MYRKLLQKLVGKIILLNRSHIGKVLEVKGDYFTLLTENDGVVYIITNHVKSISVSVKGYRDFDIDTPRDFTYSEYDNFADLLRSLRYKYIQINGSVEGILTGGNEEFIILTFNDEIIRLAKIHIQNFSAGLDQNNEGIFRNKKSKFSD